VPELPEVESYRKLAESAALGRRVAEVEAADAWYVKGGIAPAVVATALRGRTLLAARRTGKLLLIDTGASDGAANEQAGSAGPVLGLRFGMSGRLVVDGKAGVDRLLYSPTGPDGRWVRFALHFADGGHLQMVDPRRLGGVELDPDEARLGPDALGLTPAQLRRALAGAHTPLKARLLDQERIAGIGNLLADEALWRAGLAPQHPAGALSPAELRRLHRHLPPTLCELSDRGGSHTGDLMAERRPGGHCPRDGAALSRSTVGGRTSWWCPAHQR
jgi:formamidopyrimidine-DNA glycosylase